MNDASLKTLEQIQVFLAGTADISFSVPADEKELRYFIESVLKRFRYLDRPKGQRGILTDPRAEYRTQWDLAGAPLLEGMPDDALRALGIDPYCAIITTAHEPKVDDMALLEALKSDAFYVGALGSKKTSASRRIRLALFDLTPQQIERLHAPAGLSIGSHTPPEIALAMIAEVIAVRNGMATNPAGNSLG